MPDTKGRNALIKVAKLYYMGGMSQDQIARVMGVSRPKISRMLSLARQNKIVDIRISDSPLLNEQMAEKLRSHFSLKSVTIVPSEPLPAATLRAAAKVAGQYLDSVLTNGMRIGISWGTTLAETVAQFDPGKKYSDCFVVQLSGGIRTQSTDIDSREIAHLLANKLNADCSLLQAPLVVSSGSVKRILLNEPDIAAHFKLYDALDAALVGLGSVLPQETMPYKAGYLTLKQSQSLIDDGFATDICGNRIYKDGTIRPNMLTDRLITIPPELIRRTPHVIAVAVGDDKAPSIIAGAKGGFIDALITDEVAAISVMSAEGID